MLCSIGSSVLETSELSTIVPDGDDFLITMKNGQQLKATKDQVIDVCRAADESAPVTAATLESAMSGHASSLARATRHAGDTVKEGLSQSKILVLH